MFCRRGGRHRKRRSLCFGLHGNGSPLDFILDRNLCRFCLRLELSRSRGQRSTICTSLRSLLLRLSRLLLLSLLSRLSCVHTALHSRSFNTRTTRATSSTSRTLYALLSLFFRLSRSALNFNIGGFFWSDVHTRNRSADRARRTIHLDFCDRLLFLLLLSFLVCNARFRSMRLHGRRRRATAATLFFLSLRLLSVTTICVSLTTLRLLFGFPLTACCFFSRCLRVIVDVTTTGVGGPTSFVGSTATATTAI